MLKEQLPFYILMKLIEVRLLPVLPDNRARELSKEIANAIVEETQGHNLTEGSELVCENVVEFIPLSCRSDAALLDLITGATVSLDCNKLDAAGELVSRLNPYLPAGIELRFTTDTFPNPALDAPAERAAQREVDSQVDSDDAVIKMEYLRSTRTQRFAIETTVEKGSELVCQTISVNTVVKTGDDVFVQTKNFKNGAQI